MEANELERMTNWQDQYRWKVATADEAVRAIPPRTRILIGSGAAEPSRLVEAMVRVGTHLSGNEIVHLLTLGPAPYVAPGLEGRFRHTSFFIGANVRSAVQEGRADFMPVFLSEIPLLIQNGRVKVDVAVIQVSPPDRHGFCSLGVSVDIVRAAVDTAALVLAEVNTCSPIIALPSTARGGTISRIQPGLEEGAGVVTSRGDIRYVVT